MQIQIKIQILIQIQIQIQAQIQIQIQIQKSTTKSTEQHSTLQALSGRWVTVQLSIVCTVAQPMSQHTTILGYSAIEYCVVAQPMSQHTTIKYKLQPLSGRTA